MYCHARLLCRLCIGIDGISGTETEPLRVSFLFRYKNDRKTTNLHQLFHVVSSRWCRCHVVGIEGLMATLTRTARRVRISSYIEAGKEKKTLTSR